MIGGPDIDGKNRYCERLGISPPRVEDFVSKKGIKLSELLIAALLERGGPMTLPELVERLARAGVRSPCGDLSRTLSRAWGGREPIHRDGEGRYALNVVSERMRWFLSKLGLIPGPRSLVRPSPPDLEQPDDSVPLSAEELDVAFRGRTIWSVSSPRQAAAVLDVVGRALPVAEVERILAELTAWRVPVTAERARRWPSNYVRLTESGMLELDPSDPGMRKMRNEIRKLAMPGLQRKIRERHDEELAGRLEAEHRVRRRELEAGAALARRAILHCLPDPTEPAAFGLLDLADSKIRIFPAGASEELARDLLDYDILCGLEVRAIVHALDLDGERFTLRDLGPPKKTRKLNRRGRLLTITPELLITGTTGLPRPLGIRAKVLEYVEHGHLGKLRRRLAGDLKSLLAFYRYGVLHRAVRLRWGFLDEMVSVDWAEQGDVSLHDQVQAAEGGGRAIEVVAGTAPGWKEPWNRARRVRTGLFDEETGERIDWIEIQALRIL